MEITLPPEDEALLEDLGIRSNRTKAEVIADAVRAYVEHERWFREAVAQGQRSAREGRLLDHEEVGTMLRNRFAK
jgi:predicted transcriptional regulator